MNNNGKKEQIKLYLIKSPKTWLATGFVRFVGFNLLESLLMLNQKIIGLNNVSTGYLQNLDEVRSRVADEQRRRFDLNEGDICSSSGRR